MSKHLVVIPYLASGAQGDELTLAVEGWRRDVRQRHPGGCAE